MGTPQLQGAIDLNQLPRHTIIKNTDNKAFEADINKLVASGWQVVNIQSDQAWSEVSQEYNYSFVAILAKVGLQ